MVVSGDYREVWLDARSRLDWIQDIATRRDAALSPLDF